MSRYWLDGSEYDRVRDPEFSPSRYSVLRQGPSHTHDWVCELKWIEHEGWWGVHFRGDSPPYKPLAAANMEEAKAVCELMAAAKEMI